MDHIGSENIVSVVIWSTLGQGHWVGHDMEHGGSGKTGSVMTWNMVYQERLGRS